MDVEALRSHPLFEGLSDDDLQRCAGWFTEEVVPAGGGLASQDEFAYKFYVVLDGEVDVHRDFDFVARIGPGDFFGEMGLLAGERRNARVIGHSRCTLGCMMTWDFKTMVEAFPIIGERIDGVVAERRAGIDEQDQQK